MMYMCTCVLVFVVTVRAAEMTNQVWDLAVAIDDRIEFLSANGTLLGVTNQEFKSMKAVGFDEIRHQLIISDKDDGNDAIYSLPLSTNGMHKPIITQIMDDVKYLAVDPVDDILYWTDSFKRRIMWLSLNHTDSVSHILFEFENEEPQGIAIDSCRRKLYWTNANHPNATVERSNLDGSDREVIVADDIFMPSGITVDQGTGRIYWADERSGIYFRIERANLDGSDRHIVLEDTHQTPYGIAIGREHIYWTDINNEALWSIKKGENGAKIIRNFNEPPTGLVSRNNNYKDNTECQQVIDIISHSDGAFVERYVAASDSIQCLNFGELTSNGCKCQRGFVGQRCEVNLCHNYCMNGACAISSRGYPYCKCRNDYIGRRCEYQVCRDFCMNGGECDIKDNSAPVCKCKHPFSGARCERLDNPHDLCTCENGEIIFPISGEPYCRCDKEIDEYATVKMLRNNSNLQEPVAASYKTEIVTRLTDPFVMALMFTVFLLFIMITVLSIAVHRLRHRRPRIKKRYIVNNVTPMTCRPNQPTEQCEITIENCCNMNICETPCFEPSQLRSFQSGKKEEKKTLLASMENGEDLY